MTPAAARTQLDIYQHDSARMLEFVLRGELAGSPVQNLEHAWAAAASTLGKRELAVDLSAVTGADRHGTELLSRMRESGARLTASGPPASPELLHSVGIPAAPAGRSRGQRQPFRAWLRSILRIDRLDRRRHPLAVRAPHSHA